VGKSNEAIVNITAQAQNESGDVGVSIFCAVGESSVCGPYILSFLQGAETRRLRGTCLSFIAPLSQNTLLQSLATFHPGTSCDKCLHSMLSAEGFRDAPRAELFNVLYNDARRSGGDMMSALTAKDVFGRTLVYRAVRNKHYNALSCLLTLGAPVDDGNLFSGWSPLMLAAWMGNAQAVSILLAHGADPDFARNSGGWTPLLAAASSEHREVFYQLLDHGACLFNAKRQVKDAPNRCCDYEVMSHVLDQIKRERLRWTLRSNPTAIACNEAVNCDAFGRALKWICLKVGVQNPLSSPSTSKVSLRRNFPGSACTLGLVSFFTRG